jgi:hypothetical protein
VVNNLGLIVSRGAASNGHGGDTMFHGRNRSDKTVPGNIDMHAHGTGMSGSFAGE